MSPGTQGAAALPGSGCQPGRPVGLLEKLIAAVRPEFRTDVLVFDPRDPVFGGPACAAGCQRPARRRGLCPGHYERWRAAGKPDLAEFAAATPPDMAACRQLPACEIAGCLYGQTARGICERHRRQWQRAGCPELVSWRASAPPPPSPRPAACQMGHCDLWACPSSLFCRSHHVRWTKHGRPDADQFAISCQDAGRGAERIDLRQLPGTLRLEVQYVLQGRRDEQRAPLVPATVQRILGDLAATGVTSLLDRPEPAWEQFGPRRGRGCGWRAFALDARQRIEALAVGSGWDIEYPRDVWRLRNLGITSATATIRFGKIPQPWLKDLAKRWGRWRLAAGTEASGVAAGVRAITRLGVFLASPPVTASRLARLDRQLLERYLAGLHAEYAGRQAHIHHLSALNGFFTAIRRHGWDDTLPASTAIYPEDWPKQPRRLPRALAAQIAAQLQTSAALDLWDNPAYRLITVILIRCGLRVGDAARLPFSCIVTDADGAPYLRYYNHKMKREALVPIDEELRQQISDQQQRTLRRWPAGTPALFPRPTSNLDGHMPIRGSTYRAAMGRWLPRCDVRDEHGQPVKLVPHQWRHTLGTALINKDVPQEVVRRILDHESHEMTAIYARLSDATIRRHWEAARKVNATGEDVTLDPDGPLAEAAWARQRLGRATQALPNGFCGLPLARTCPHANACLTCPLFVTTAEFLPQHRAQHATTLEIISVAEARGQTRMAQMNRQVAGNLEKIITALENDEEGTPGMAADAP